MQIEMVSLMHVPAEVRAVLQVAADQLGISVERLRADLTTRYGAVMRTVMWYLTARLQPRYKPHQVAAFCGRRSADTVRHGRGKIAHKFEYGDSATRELVQLFDHAVAQARGQDQETETQALHRRMDAAERELAAAERNIRILKRLVRAMEASLRRAGVPISARA